MKHASLALLWLTCGSVANATTYTWTQDSLTNHSNTINATYAGHTVAMGTDWTATGRGVYITGPTVTLDGNGNTLLYGTAGGDNVYGIEVSAVADGSIIREVTVCHDPENDGDDADVADTFGVQGCSAIYIGGTDGIQIRACSLKVYGWDARCVESYASSSENTIIDSCQMWNHGIAFIGRQSYGGAAIRLECRGTYTGGDFAAHIYRTKVHKSAHAGIAINGKVSTIRLRGVEVAYCTLYTDHVNQYHDPGNTQAGSSANAYGILIKDGISPISIHHNYLGAGTSQGGSRGLMLENLWGTAEDYVDIHDNVAKQWCGPDDENATGVYRGLRIRGIDPGGCWDYVHIYNNWFEVTTDNDGGTTHIGSDGFGMNISLDGGSSDICDDAPATGHLIVENNTLVFRSLNATGTFGSAQHVGVEDTYEGVPPFVIKNNHYISSCAIVSTQDFYNGYSSHDVVFEKDTLSFLPDADSGVMVTSSRPGLSSPHTWYIGYNLEQDTNGVARSCYYDTLSGASDTDIRLHSSAGPHDWTLVQRIPISVMGNNNLQVQVCSLMVRDVNDDTVVCKSINTSELVDVGYFYTSGTNAGTDVSYNPYDVWAYVGGNSIHLDDTTLNWKTPCLTLHLSSTAGTLTPDTCVAMTGGGDFVLLDPVPRKRLGP